MLGTSSHPVRNAMAAAAVSVTAFLAAVGVSPATAQTIAKNAPPPAAQGVVFTPEQCRTIMAMTTSIVGRVGADNLSLEFRQGMVNFIMHGGQMTCAGPRVIPWRTREDWATFTNITSSLETPSVNIRLERAGVVLAPTPVASLSLR